MASSDHLFIDPSGVRGAAETVATGAATAGAQPVSITPSAMDTTSVLIANTLGGLVSDLINATAAVNARTAAAAGRMSANVDTYEQQELANQSALANPGGSAPAAAAVGTVPDAPVPTAIPAPVAAGTTPATGRDIAALIHGGPGPAALDAAATLLTTHADQLDEAASNIRSARWQSDASWDSDAADAATAHLAGPSPNTPTGPARPASWPSTPPPRLPTSVGRKARFRHRSISTTSNAASCTPVRRTPTQRTWAATRRLWPSTKPSWRRLTRRRSTSLATTPAVPHHWRKRKSSGKSQALQRVWAIRNPLVRRPVLRKATAPATRSLPPVPGCRAPIPVATRPPICSGHPAAWPAR